MEYEGVDSELLEFLEHHGVLGQKWGVRRFQNSDGSLTAAGRERYGYGPKPNERTTLAKGTRLNSVSFYGNSKAYQKSGKWMYTYNPYDKWDKKVYNGPFSVYKAESYLGLLTYEHSYQVVKDLKMPNSSERFDEFVKLYEKNVETFTKELQYIQDRTRQYDMGPANVSAQKVDLSNVKTDEDLVAAYKLFNHAMENVAAFKMTKMYADEMSKKFDAMVDDNNQGVYNEAHDPIIIFDPKHSLKAVDKPRKNTVEDVMTDYNDVKAELKKKGKNVAL